MAVKLVLLAVFCVFTAKAVEFDCDFNVTRFPSGEELYTCTATVALTNSSTLQSVEGEHLEGRLNEDVEFLFIRYQNLPFVPESIDQFFGNLTAVLFWSTQLFTISAGDLRQFPGLTHFFSYENPITSLDGDLFSFNPNLSDVEFEDNQIENIGFDLLTNLADRKFFG